eukprot:GAFH01006178.1.p4 GENE.GAFH01006178.1~~GAFH01006178.1.p4  ORF type:complete len:101 (-),score=34.85 GAFH01006178.1:171-473(-)
MQSMFGSVESVAVNGTEFCPLLTWDSKITTVQAMCGGSGPHLRDVLVAEGHYGRFVSVLNREWSLVFGSGPLRGEDVPIALPTAKVPKDTLRDFANCPSN